MHGKKKRLLAGKYLAQNRNKIVTVLLIMLLIAAVRAYYWTGPIFANSIDEMYYFSVLSQTTVFHTPFNFAQYNVTDFGNVTNYPFTPPNVHQFYVGMLYPEILLADAFGFHTTLVLWYIIFNSMVEGAAIFLILDLIWSRKAAVIGGVLLAFFPIDVLFSKVLQPLVPMVAMMAISIYFLLLADKRYGIRRGHGKLLYFLCGVFMGLGFWVNPLITVEAMAITLLFAYRIARKGDRLRELYKYAAIVLGGFLVYSIMGVVFLLQAGRFFLYPEVYHIFFLWQMQFQPYTTVHVLGNVFFKYTFGVWYEYIPIIFNLPMHSYMPELRYFSIMIYVFMLASVVLLAQRNRWMPFFLVLFVVGLAFIELAPTGLSMQNGNVYVYITNMSEYCATILTIPVIVISAIFLDVLLKDRRRLIKLIGCAIIVAILVFDVIDNNANTALYRASTSTLHSLASFVEEHGNSIFYATYSIATETAALTNYKYNINIINCNASQVYSNPGSYVIVGGTISTDITPQVVQQFDQCIEDNLTGFTTVYTANNPYGEYVGSGNAPQLQVLRQNVT